MGSMWKKRKMIKCILLCSWASLVLASTVSKNESLRRRRLEVDQPGKSSHTGKPANLKVDRNIWDEAVAAAHLEADGERELYLAANDFAMSLPTTFPTIAPVQPPTVQPPTVQPTHCSEGKPKEQYLYDLLAEETEEEILNDQSTPQGKAYQHIRNSDQVLSDPCAVSADTIKQRYGLTTFFYGMEGENWVENGGWLGGDDECDWFGVECNENSDSIRILKLKENNLIGSFPNEISIFETMERLELYANNVFGEIPSAISALSDLLLFDVEQNLLSGAVLPDSLPDSLIAYRASSNFLEGSIPTSITRFSKLEQIWLGDCPLTGTIPSEIGLLTDLQYIFFYDSTFQGDLMGTLPSELGNLKKLIDFRLYGNQVGERIPSGLFGATSLETLILDNNFFIKSLPTEIGKLSNLGYLRLDGNQITGTLPTEIGRMVHLENFIINNNWFSGAIPNVFQGFDRLDFLDLSSNRLDGSIPDTIFQIPSLRIVYLSNNTLTGTIPSEYSTPSLLRDLYLDGNRLTGTIPPVSSGQLQDLNEFLVQNNFLSGSMPQSVCELRGENGDLDDLFSDCGGQNPRILCSFPACCNRCFEIDLVAQRKLREIETLHLRHK